MMKRIRPGSNVLVTGATGYTGTVLVKKLIALDLNIRAIARASSNISAFKGLSIEWIPVNESPPTRPPSELSKQTS